MGKIKLLIGLKKKYNLNLKSAIYVYVPTLMKKKSDAEISQDQETTIFNSTGIAKKRKIKTLQTE